MLELPAPELFLLALYVRSRPEIYFVGMGGETFTRHEVLAEFDRRVQAGNFWAGCESGDGWSDPKLLN